jgi:hypothetical protein
MVSELKSNIFSLIWPIRGLAQKRESPNMGAGSSRHSVTNFVVLHGWKQLYCMQWTLVGREKRNLKTSAYLWSSSGNPISQLHFDWLSWLLLILSNFIGKCDLKQRTKRAKKGY